MRLAPGRPVLKMRAKRHRNLARRRTRTARRLHAVLCGPVPGGIGKDIMAADVACEEQFARVGSAPLVEACHPLSMTDAPVLALVIVAGLLLLPDLSALEIPGVVRFLSACLCGHGSMIKPAAGMAERP